jgi:hypothetical protein
MFMWKNCNIYIMEMIESIVWVMTGFSLTLVTMEVGWRLTKAQTRKVSITRPIAMEQEIEVQ